MALACSLCLVGCTCSDPTPPPETPFEPGLDPHVVREAVGTDFGLAWVFGDDDDIDYAARESSFAWDSSMTDPAVVTTMDPQFMEFGWVRRPGNIGIIESGYLFEFRCAGIGETVIRFDYELLRISTEEVITGSDQAMVYCSAAMMPDGGPMDTGADTSVPEDSSRPDTGDAGPPAPRLVEPAAIIGRPDEDLRVLDERLFALLGIAIPTAASPIATPTVISGSHDVVWGGGPITGSGVPFVVPVDAAYVDADTTFVVDSDTNQLIRTDHKDGSRTEISGPTVGSGPAIDAPHSVVYDARTALSYIGLSPFGGAPSVLEVDSDGDRTEIWRGASGGGGCGALDLYEEDNALLMVCANDILRLDLGSGAETVIADFESGPGLPLWEAIQMDHTTNRIAMISGGVDSFAFFDIGTGEVLVVSSNDRGTGPEIIRLEDLLYFAAFNRAFVVDGSHDTVMEIDTVTGDRAHVTMPE